MQRGLSQSWNPRRSTHSGPRVSRVARSTSFGASSWCVLLAALWGALTVGPSLATAGDWPQFRGAQGSGRAVGAEPLPTEIGPQAPTVWKTELPPGHSSPVVVGDRVYLTGVREQKLVTIALDRGSGKIVWENEAPHEKLEQIHGIGSHAQSSPASDGERVISFFGSSGIYCHDRDGKLLWHHRMGPFNNDFGAASSPIIVGDKVVLCQDHDTGSFLMALDKRTGEVLWKTDRSEFPRNYCTPVVWRNQGRDQIVIAATLRVVGYDLESGQEQWTVRGISRTVCMTPVVGDGGLLYVAGWAAGGDKESPIRIAPFAEIIGKLDANKNGLLEEKELEDGPVKQRFTQIDRNNDDGIGVDEYEYFRSLLEQGRNLVIAIRPNPSGDATATHVAWENDRFVPFCASPLFVNGLVFTVKDGGIVSCLDAQTGKAHKTGRLPHTDAYYASPVAGDGKVYFVNQEGQLTVTSAEPGWTPLHTADFGEEVYATPALVDGRIYLRTDKALYCFGR